LARLCVLTAFVSAAALMFASAAAGAVFPARGAAAEVVAHPFLLGTSVALAALYQSFSSLLLRQGRIGAMAMLRIVQGGSFALLALLTPLGLLWSHALSFAAGLGMLRFAARPGLAAWRGWRQALATYRVFAQQGLPGAALDVVGYSLCTWTVLGVYGIANSGTLSQIQRVVGAPLMLASMSLAQILLRHSAELKDDRTQLRRLIGQLLLLMGLGAAGLILFLALWGERFLGWLLGAQWQIDVTAILAICGAVVVRACVSPISGVLATFRRFDLALKWQALYLCSALILFTLFTRALAFDNFLIFYMLHEAVLYGIYLRIIYSVLKH